MDWFGDQIIAAVQHAERVWPYNEIAAEDMGVEAAVLAAIHTVTLWPRDKGFPGFRIVYPCPGGKTYYSELVQGPEWIERWCHHGLTGWCGRCETQDRTDLVLYVPAGETIVGVELCRRCAHFMLNHFRPLAWMTDGGTLMTNMSGNRGHQNG